MPEDADTSHKALCTGAALGELSEDDLTASQSRGAFSPEGLAKLFTSMICSGILTIGWVRNPDPACELPAEGRWGCWPHSGVKP